MTFEKFSSTSESEEKNERTLDNSIEVMNEEIREKFSEKIEPNSLENSIFNEPKVQSMQEAGTENLEEDDLDANFKVPEKFLDKNGNLDPSKVLKSALESEKKMHEYARKLADYEKNNDSLSGFGLGNLAENQNLNNENQKSREYVDLLSQISHKRSNEINDAFRLLNQGLISPEKCFQFVTDKISEYDKAKDGIRSYYENLNSERSAMQEQIYQQNYQNLFRNFEETNREKIQKPYNKKLLERFKSKYADCPEELEAAFELAESYLQDYLEHKKEIEALQDENNQEKSRLSSSIDAGQNFSGGYAPFTYEDLIEDRVPKYLVKKHLDYANKLLARGK